MLIRSLRNQFLHDLKASWPKTLLLGSLLLVGLYFWIPPLLRAMGSSPRNSAVDTALSPMALLSQVPKVVPPRASTGSSTITWEKADKIIATDPLVRSAEVAAIHGNPFQLAPDQFSPPILFADPLPNGELSKTHPNSAQSAGGAKTNVAGKSPAGQSAASDSAPVTNTPDGLVLKSTILGEKRRAALINDKLYSEGSLIQVDGTSYILSVVRAREVELRKGEQTFLLALPSAITNPNIQVERVGTAVESP